MSRAPSISYKGRVSRGEGPHTYRAHTHTGPRLLMWHHICPSRHLIRWPHCWPHHWSHCWPSGAGGKDCSRRVINPSRCSRFALSVFRCKTGPPGVPYTPGCSVAVRLPLGVPLPSGPPRCSGFFRSPSVFRCAPRPSAFCSVLLLAISARVTLRGGYKKCRLQ